MVQIGNLARSRPRSSQTLQVDDIERAPTFT